VVTIERGPLIALLAIGGVVIVVTILLAWRARRAMVRRLTVAALRMETHPPAAEPRGLDKTVARLERAVDRSVLRVRDATIGESRLERSLEVIPQAVVICDDQGDIVYRNAAADAFGTGRHGDALVAGNISELLERALDGRTDKRTLDLFGPPRRTLLLSSAPLDDGSQTLGALVVIDDVSERRRLEAVRRDFVANISHELKTPIGGLGILAETLLSEADPAVSRRLAGRMQHEAFRVGRLIDDLLELSRIEAEESRAREPVPVHLVTAEAVERIHSVAESAGIEIKVNEAPRSLAVLGDRRQLTSALYNLLENAVKYSDPGGTVDVRAGLADGVVEITVQDHGIGIPLRDLERVFERFYRVDRARSRQTGGTGLGLAIVRHVAANHHGEVSVQSREGEGSTFTLRLPAGPGPVAVSTAHAG
jgi:two-component system sensor histidine kinase SenX3